MPQEKCYNSTIAMYMGHVNVSFLGEPCKTRWDSNHDWAASMFDDHFPEGSVTAANNYCRDPFFGGALWCLLDPPTQNNKRWETCNIPRCMTGNCRLFKDALQNALKRQNIDGVSHYIQDA